MFSDEEIYLNICRNVRGVLTFVIHCTYIWKKIMDSNPTVCEAKLTTCNPNWKGRLIEKQSRHYSVSVLLNHHQGYEGLYYIILYIHLYLTSLLIIHLRCIREVFSDALSSLPISGYFCIISAPTVTPVWLWKSQAASVIATRYARASTKAKKELIRPDVSRSYRHLSFSK